MRAPDRVAAANPLDLPAPVAPAILPSRRDALRAGVAAVLAWPALSEGAPVPVPRPSAGMAMRMARDLLKTNGYCPESEAELAAVLGKHPTIVAHLRRYATDTGERGADACHALWVGYFLPQSRKKLEDFGCKDERDFPWLDGDPLHRCGTPEQRKIVDLHGNLALARTRRPAGFTDQEWSGGLPGFGKGWVVYGIATHLYMAKRLRDVDALSYPDERKRAEAHDVLWAELWKAFQESDAWKKAYKSG